MRLIRKLEKSRTFWFLLIISSLFFLLRLPSLFEPYWYGDEGIYHAIGNALNNGGKMYLDAWDNKPPFLFIIYSLLQSDQFLVRTLSMVFGLLSIPTFFYISQRLFKSFNHSIISTTVFAVLYGLPIVEGNIANAENFLTLFVLIGVLYVLRLTDRGKYLDYMYRKRFFLAGLLFSVAFLFKIVAIFDFLAISVFLIFVNTPNEWRSQKPFLLILKFKELYLFWIGFLLPILLVPFYFLMEGTINLYLRAFLTGNLSYVGKENILLIPQGLLILKISLLFLAILLLFAKRSKIDKTTLFILIWFGFSLFNSLFSNRPYTHYLIVLLPSLSLLVALTFYDQMVRKLTVIVLIVSILFINWHFIVYEKNLSYYFNFISFVTGKKSVYDYRAFFDKNTPNDYDLANFIKTSLGENEHVYIWGDNAQVYTIANTVPPSRYSVSYHARDYEDGLDVTKKSLDEKKPKLIVIMSNTTAYPFSLDNYYEKLKIGNATIYERIL